MAHVLNCSTSIQIVRRPVLNRLDEFHDVLHLRTIIYSSIRFSYRFLETNSFSVIDPVLLRLQAECAKFLPSSCYPFRTTERLMNTHVDLRYM
jgi:hypothetical protein